MGLTFDAKTGEWVGTTGGVDLQNLSKKSEDKKTVKKSKVKKSKEQILKEIDAHPIFGFAKRLAEYVIEQSDFDCHNVVFRNRWSCVDFRANKPQMILGYKSLRDSYEVSFREYKTVQYIWHNHGIDPNSLTEKEAVWAEVIHEAAHIAQRNESKYDKPHGQLFQDKLNELIILFPFEEVKNL